MTAEVPHDESLRDLVQAEQSLGEYLRSLRDDHAELRLGDEVLVLPRATAEHLLEILSYAVNGQSVTVVPEHAQLTTQQAADMLNVSRPYLIKLLEAGEIEYTKVGTHRRVLARSLRDYKTRDDKKRREYANELGQLTQDLGLN